MTATWQKKSLFFFFSFSSEVKKRKRRRYSIEKESVVAASGWGVERVLISIVCEDSSNPHGKTLGQLTSWERWERE